MKKLIEEQNQENKEKQSEKNQDQEGDSCGVNDKDKYTDPQASNPDGSSSGELEDGEVIQRTYPTTDGDIDVSGPVSVENDGKTVRVEISVFPSDPSKKAELGTKEVRKVLRQLENEARDKGFEQLRITGYRTRNFTYDPETLTPDPGRRIDITIDLNK